MKRILLSLGLMIVGTVGTPPSARAREIIVRPAIPIIRHAPIVRHERVIVLPEPILEERLRLIRTTREVIHEPDGRDVIVTRRVYEEPGGDLVTREERRVTDPW
jgi:hypothetical protein